MTELLFRISSKERIFSITQTISKEYFMQSVLHQDAVIRSLEVIGEAANKLSDEFCSEYPEIPIRNMVGIRNILIHNYSIVNLGIVWDTVTNDIPSVYEMICSILES